MQSLSGKLAIVTGASSGIGLAMARQLAERKADLVLVARRRDRLEALATSLREAHGVKVDVVALDLGVPSAAASLYEQTEGAGRRVDVLINNAGFGTHERFVEIPWDVMAQQIQLNIVSLTDLTYRFVRAMLPRKQGWILNVASVGAYTPVPTYATYGAGKAYVRNFTEALAYELRGTGVHMCCLNPGATATEFMEVAGHEVPWYGAVAIMPADKCARVGLRALFAGRRNVVAGWYNALAMFWTRFLPRPWMASMAAMSMASTPKDAARAQLPSGSGPPS